MAAQTLSDFDGFLTPAESAPIFDEATRMSAFQQLIPQVTLGVNGQKIPHITSKPVANWVGEGGEKPKTNLQMGLKYIEPKKLASIAVMSAEVVRSDPGMVTGQLRPRLAEAFARAFDFAVGYGLGGDGTGTGPFDASLSDTANAVEIGTTTQANGGVHGDLVAALSLLVADGRRLTGFALDDAFEPLLLGATDANGRPLYVDTINDQLAPSLRMGSLLGRRSYMSEDVGNGTTIGFGGDWSKAAWGAVGGISYRVSTEATVTIDGVLTSLWEHNLVAVLAEAEYGFVISDTAEFVKFTDAV